MILQRRSFLTGLAAAFAAPAIVRASSLMPVKAIPFDPDAALDRLVATIEYDPDWMRSNISLMTMLEDGSVLVRSVNLTARSDMQAQVLARLDKGERIEKVAVDVFGGNINWGK